MTEPASTATFIVHAATVPVLTAFGMSLGLRPDILLAGFGGAVAAITLLNSVPATGDTLIELLRTSVRRVGVSIGSAVMAGYVAPMLAWIDGVPNPFILGIAFVVGAGAMRILPKLIDRMGNGRSPVIPKDDHEAAGVPK